MPKPTEDPEPATAELTILVIRTGGMAGMSRRWSVEPAGDETARWIGLVDRCPWDDDPGAGTGADRYLWRIEVRMDRAQHEQVIPEEHLTGPWRELVDAVRSAGSA